MFGVNMCVRCNKGLPGAASVIGRVHVLKNWACCVMNLLENVRKFKITINLSQNVARITNLQSKKPIEKLLPFFPC